MGNCYKWLASATLILFLSACSTAPTQPSKASPTAARAGFLQDYNRLVQDSREPGYQHYVAPSMLTGKYRSFIIDDPVFIVNTRDGYEAISPAHLQAMADYYKTRMATALGTHYRVADAPGPGVARLRIAVVGLVEVGPDFQLSDLVPAKALFNAARAVADKTPHQLQISIESEALDSQTSQVLGATVDSRQSTKTVSGSDAHPSDEQVHDLIDFWVARFVSRLDRVNGYPVNVDGQRGQ